MAVAEKVAVLEIQTVEAAGTGEIAEEEGEETAAGAVEEVVEVAVEVEAEEAGLATQEVVPRPSRERTRNERSCFDANHPRRFALRHRRRVVACRSCRR